MATPEATLKLEIARLTGAINRHRSGEGQARPPYATTRTTYVNPSYKPPPSKAYVRPGYQASSVTPTPSANSSAAVRPPPGPGPSRTQPRDVTINGVVFESSKRSLVRKDSACMHSSARPLAQQSLLVKPSVKPPSSGPRPRVMSQFSRNKSEVSPRTRVYKPKGPSRSRLKFDNTHRAYQSQGTHGRKKYVDKPCPRFTTTGSCNRGLTCAYKHDPAKIAICWPYLQNNCPHTSETCALSHDSNPHRTPLCVHFANAGRCTRANCLYPHVRVGRRDGVCRDFAVLGYCEAGIECLKQHVRECPDFAESGECPNKFCKLPHVIRANRARKPTSTPVPVTVAVTSAPVANDLVSAVPAPTLTAEDGQLGDEYISLTFNESEEDQESSDDEDDDDQEESASLSPSDEDAA
ncbi:hypothetical protein BJV78DRAFT_1364670 [Lactifluus subvellereus]|nr:hypothetical protein BJV78DRAFT_1364670 [Lactifluus subvellereus]